MTGRNPINEKIEKELKQLLRFLMIKPYNFNTHHQTIYWMCSIVLTLTPHQRKTKQSTNLITKTFIIMITRLTKLNYTVI